MAEMLWVQAAGVDYSAAEDRRLISSMFSAGVLFGLSISAGTGLSARVSAGRCVIDDGAGGAYIAYFDNSTTVSSLTPSAANNIYAVGDLTTGQATIVRSSSTPTGPNLLLGSAVTSTTAVTTVNNTAATAEVPTVGGRYLLLSGGAVTGKATFNNIDIGPGSMTASSGFAPKFPLGARLGGAGSPTMRAGALATRGSGQTIPNAAWTKLQFTSTSRSINDYSSALIHDTTTTTTQGQFVVPATGVYVFSGGAFFDAPSGTVAGTRRSRLAQYDSGGTLTFWKQCTLTVALAGNANTPVTFEAMLDCTAGDVVQFEVYQDQGAALALTVGTATDGHMAYGRMRLVQGT